VGVAASAAAEAAGQFAIDARGVEVQPHPGGHIHEAFLVTADRRRFMLQRMNARVFPRPELVVANIAAVTEHLTRKGTRTLRLVPARAGGWLARPAAGGAWRMSEFIEGSVTLETARDALEAERAAAAIGEFQRALADYAGPTLHLTLPGFHDTARRVAALDRAAEAAEPSRVSTARDVLEGLRRHRTALADFFARARAEDPARERIAHHDAKIANVLFDARTKAVLCVIDLDTVMPGLSLYDFGDLVRSMVSPAAEDEPDPSRVHAEAERYAAIVRGYLAGTGAMIGDAERRLLPGAAEAMVFEQGVRFLTDYLEGDRYYRIARPEHNLERARAQLALLDSLAAQGAEFRRMVR